MIMQIFEIFFFCITIFPE